MSIYRTRIKPLSGARINFAHPLGVGLVQCYLFNEGSGLRAYDACSTARFLYLNPAGSSNIFRLTNVGFAGSSYGGLVADCGYPATGGIALEGIDVGIPSGAKPRTVFWRSLRHTAANECEWQLGTSGIVGEMFAFRSTSSTSADFLGWGADVSATCVSVLDQWCTWAVVFDGATIFIYQNGKLIGSGAATLNTVLTTRLLISGEDFGGGASLPAMYDFWMCYSRALRPEEITTLTNSPFQMFGPVSSVKRAAITSITASVAAVAATATATAPVPDIFANSVVNAVPGTATADGPAPSLTVGVNITAVAGTAVAAGPAPSLSVGYSVSAVPGAAIAAGKAPSLSVGANVHATPGAAIAAGRAPALVVGVTISVVPATATAAAPAPAVGSERTEPELFRPASQSAPEMFRPPQGSGGAQLFRPSVPGVPGIFRPGGN